MMGTIGEKVCAACAIGLMAWRGEGLRTVGQVHDAYVRICHRVDQLMHDPDASQYFVAWYDNQPRDVVRGELLREVERELLVRRAGLRGDCITLRGEPCTESACSSTPQPGEATECFVVKSVGDSLLPRVPTCAFPERKKTA
jgi:hypothetical protein